MFSVSLLCAVQREELESIISWRGCSTLLGHYWHVLIDCYWWKIFRDLIDLNADAPSWGRRNQLVFSALCERIVFPVASHHNSAPRQCRDEDRPSNCLISLNDTMVVSYQFRITHFFLIRGFRRPSIWLEQLYQLGGMWTKIICFCFILQYNINLFICHFYECVN